MSSLSRIIAATDFSKAAHNAVLRAAQLASLHRCPLTLVHVFNDSAWASLRRVFDEDSLSLRPLEDAQQRLQALADGLTSYGADAELRTGRAATEIAEIARDRSGSLIVLGEHGEGLRKDMALGGTAIKVLNNSPCPILLVRREAQHPYRFVLVASDFSENAVRACQASLACFPNVSHVVVHAYDLPLEGRLQLAGVSPEALERYTAMERERARQAMKKFIQDSGAATSDTVAAHVKKGHPVPALLEEIRAEYADVIVLAKHSGPALAQRLLGSVTQSVLHHAPGDVLLVP